MRSVAWEAGHTGTRVAECEEAKIDGEKCNKCNLSVMCLTIRLPSLQDCSTHIACQTRVPEKLQENDWHDGQPSVPLVWNNSLCVRMGVCRIRGNKSILNMINETEYSPILVL